LDSQLDIEFSDQRSLEGNLRLSLIVKSQL